MRKPNYNVQVLETAADDSFLPAKELLPWADPYIAALMGRLTSEYGDSELSEQEDETWDFDSEQLDVEDEAAQDASQYWLSDELAPEDSADDFHWHLDRAPAVPPVYGGWPLLDDLRTESRHENV